MQTSVDISPPQASGEILLQWAQAVSVDHLAEYLEKCNEAYYNATSGPLIADDLYDQVRTVLEKRAPDHSLLRATRAAVPIGEMTPTKGGGGGSLVMTFGGELLTNPYHRQEQPLPYWMGGMVKIKGEGGGLGNWCSKNPGPYHLSHKLDGISGLFHRRGERCWLYTGGDGASGQDISHLLPYLRMPSGGGDITVRGEIILSRANFRNHFVGTPNPRNVVSGVVNSKSLRTGILQYIDFIAYELIAPEGFRPSDQFWRLQEAGFQVAVWEGDVALVTEASLRDRYAAARAGTSLDRAMPGQDLVPATARTSLYDIDGIIVTSDCPHVRATEGDPKYAIAFKMLIDVQSQVRATEVVAVEWNAQKDGKLFPTIHVKPVFVSGVTIANCSGKNAKFIVDNGIGPGALVEIARDGEVIPGIYRVVRRATVILPDAEEGCYHWTTSGADLVLDDIEAHREVHFCRVLRFLKTIKAKGWSDATVRKCLDNGLTTIAAIVTAREDDLRRLPGVQAKSAHNLRTALDTALERPHQLLLMVASNAFGQGMGGKKLALLLKHCPDCCDWSIGPERRAEQLARLIAIPGFDTITAEKCLEGLPRFIAFLGSLPEDIVRRIVTEATDWAGSASCSPVKGEVAEIAMMAGGKLRFKGQTVVFTGFRQPVWEEMITREGGRVTGAVSGTTTILVIKSAEFTSTKVDKARSQGTTVLTEAEFQTLYC